MIKTFGSLSFALATLILAGCTTTSPKSAPAVEAAPMGTTPVAVTPPPSEPKVETPPPVVTAPVVTPPVVAAPAVAVELAPASIKGSEESSTMLDNFTAYVGAIDGAPVTAGRAGWNTPVRLKAGPRRLSLRFNRGVFAARADLELQAKSEASYQVRFASDAELFGKNSYCEFWIVDTATGQPVTERVRTVLTRVEAAH